MTTPTFTECSVDGCDRTTYAKTVCKSHHMRILRKGDPGGPFTKVSEMDRFMSHVDTSGGAQACHPWTAYLRGGYGSFRLGETMVVASRWILGQTIGRSLRPGEEACHTCDNPPCCNPAHLYVGDRIANMGDAIERRRFRNDPAAAKRRQTHCIRNHEFDESNTYYRGNGTRSCRACRAAAKRKSAKAMRQAVPS